MINIVLKNALTNANLSVNDLNAISVTQGPGLMGALLVGLSTAKALAFALKIPLIPINHLEGHLHSLFIEDQKNCDLKNEHTPILVCLVSGGHTELHLIDNLPFNEETHEFQKLNTKLLSTSLDDAAGEAFDKTAKLMGLSYPGGVQIDSLAQKGNKNAFYFPRPLLSKQLEFSFSGIKTAVLNKLIELKFTPHIFGQPDFTKLPQGQVLYDLCASIQDAIIDTLINKIKNAVFLFKPKSLAIVGGVSANSELRKRLNSEIDLPVFMPDLQYCTDNAAMIGANAVYKFYRKEICTENEALSLNAFSS
jgi:N6-L-threonylcarbamoyladenine synthase